MADAKQCIVPQLKDVNGVPIVGTLYNGNVINGPTFTWSILSGPGSISNQGVFSAPSTSGVTQIQVSSGGVSATATITTDATKVPGIFSDTDGNITVYINAFTSTVSMQYTTLNGIVYVTVSVSCLNSAGQNVLSQSQTFVEAKAKRIFVYGQAGASMTCVNSTRVPCTIYGGNGTNSLYGGSGQDYIQAGAGDSTKTNYLRAFSGGFEILVGGTASNYFYGQGADDTIVYGMGPNYIITQ
jgi:Ca2+-binding RTX toxin-like protein